MFAVRICNPVATSSANVIVNTFYSDLVFYSGSPHFGLPLSLLEVFPGSSSTVSGPDAVAISMHCLSFYEFLQALCQKNAVPEQREFNL